MRKPIADKVPRLRQRQRRDGSWRIWWEAEAAVQAMGFANVDLDPDRPTWSLREAARLNEAVARARRGEPARPRSAGSRTMAALIHEYRRNVLPEKAAKTRSSYEGNLRLIDRKWGSSPVTDFTKPVMFTWYEALRRDAGPTQAVRLIRMASILFSYAELIGWRGENSNPCFRLGLKVPKGRSRTASWAEIDALLAAADAAGLPSIGGAIRLSAFQGQRQTDVLAATLGAFRRAPILAPDARGRLVQITVWVWQLARQKRGTRGVMRLHPEVAPVIEARLRATDDPSAPLLVEERVGRAYDEHLFEDRWAEVRDLAARTVPEVASLQFRDLRRTFGVLARSGGASRDDVGDVLGNSAGSDPQLGEIYMPPSFDTASRAVMSIRRPSADKRKKA